MRVENAITPRLPHGTANQETIAKELGLSKRSLIGKLTDEGLSFREIMDDLRAKLPKWRRYTRLFPQSYMAAPNG
jgi:hypothetical protein